MEAMGSKSGVTARRVVIADCGELESRLQRALKLAAEKEELAASKKDPIGLDPDASAVARLRALRGDTAPPAATPQDASPAPAVPAVASASASGSAAAAAAVDTGSREAPAAAAEEREQGGEAREGKGGDEEDMPSEDAMAGLSARKRKLLELRAKSAKARKANEHATVAEFKREKKGPPNGHMERKKWLDEQKKERTVRHGREFPCAVCFNEGEKLSRLGQLSTVCTNPQPVSGRQPSIGSAGAAQANGGRQGRAASARVG